MPGNGGAGGGFGALDEGGGSGAEGGARLDDEDVGGAGETEFGLGGIAVDDGLRDAGGGIGGFLPIGGGGLGFEIENSGVLATEVGRRLLFNAATLGGVGAAPEGGKGGAPPGGEGAAPFGAGGGGAALGVEGDEDFLELVSGSESYMFTPPPLFRNLGMPPANRPPNCGAVSIADAAAGAPPEP